ncbi:HNH endonuclease [Microvirga alba]|uniref:HNH endonuclease n=1 Tax=Microvirga alba TaxID=2791025 RepID=A0A931FNF0_9HYPH|nr:HNH endonuclease [Microvirga alba]
MSRSRKEFPKAVKVATFKRCGGPDNPRCEECGQPLRPGRFQFDHIKADGFGGEPVSENCKVLCSGSRASCHSVKTEEEDKPRMRKADAQRDAHLGTTRKKAKIPQPPKAPKPPGKAPLPPRQLYEAAR